MSEKQEDAAEECCLRCRFYELGTRRCRRYPPTIVLDGANWFPYMGPEEWCGEFYDKETNDG